MSRELREHFDGPVVTLFVYGTLRPGEGNYWVEPDVIEAVEGVSTTGRMVDNGGFPYATFEGTDKRLTGTLLYLPIDSPLTRAAHQMEIGAGYYVVPVTVQLPTGGSVGAIAYGVAPDDRRLQQYPEVVSGDWKQRDHAGWDAAFEALQDQEDDDYEDDDDYSADDEYVDPDWAYESARDLRAVE